jgi:hypothetical protein
MSFGGQHNAVRTPLLRAVSDFRSSRQYARYHEPRCRLRDTRSPMRCWTTFDNVVEMIVPTLNSAIRDTSLRSNSEG